MNKTTDAKAMTHHLSQAEWWPSIFWAASTFAPQNPLLYICIAEHEILWHGIYLWPACVNCPVTSQLVMQPQSTCWGGRAGKKESHRVGKRESLDMVQALLSN